MNGALGTKHTRLGRMRQFITLATALALSALLTACNNHTEPAVPTAPIPISPPPDALEPIPTPAVTPGHSAREPDPQASKERERSIRRDADRILAECQQAANGDWNRWEQETSRYRLALRTKVDGLKPIDPPKVRWIEGSFEPLEGRDGFPLFEVASGEYLRYLLDSKSLDQFRKDQSVVAVHRWLRARGIDLIFVPIPKMTEVYIEHFLEPCPSDGIIAPHVRRTLFELLNEGVEVVDGFSLFRAFRDTDSEYLYNTADSHWAPRATRIMAKELADRIVRYRFGAKARFALPIVRTAPGVYGIPGKSASTPVGGVNAQDGWMALTERQQERAASAQTTVQSRVTLLDGRDPPDESDSPVMLIGSSFVPYFREQLIKELNLLLQTRWRAAVTTDLFADFLREPELLENCRVLVWIDTAQHMPVFKPLPAAIAAAAHSKQ